MLSVTCITSCTTPKNTMTVFNAQLRNKLSCLKWLEISFFLCVFAFSTSTCHSLPWIKFARRKLRRLNTKLQTFKETTLFRIFSDCLVQKYSWLGFSVRVKAETDRNLTMLTLPRNNATDTAHVFSAFDRESRVFFSTSFWKKCSRTSHYGPLFTTNSSVGSKMLNSNL